MDDKDKKEKKVPKLRFPGFLDEWEKYKLGDVVVVQSGKDYKHLMEGEVPVYGTGGYMLSVNEALSYDKDAIGIGRKGTIDRPYILKAPFWTVDTLFYAILRDNFNLNFIYGIFQNIAWKKKDESTGVPSLSKAAINESNILIPNFEEQQLIGDFFNKFDSIISLHQERLEHLKELKKGLLQKMFPRVGEKVPQIRFPGFTENWEQRKLGEIGSIVTGNTPPTYIPEYYSDEGMVWVTPTDISNTITYNSEKKLSTLGQKVGRVVPKNTILVTCIASIGKNTMLGVTGSFNQQINGVIVNEAQYDPYFLLTQSILWSQDMKKIAATGTMQIVNRTEFSDIKTSLPKLEEQRKIGCYFQKLDNLIALHQQKLEHLKELKKGLLQQMYV